MLALALVAASCSTRLPPLPRQAAPALFAVVTWNMNVGRGDLPRFVSDLVSGRLTGHPVTEFVLLLQEVVEGGRHDISVTAGARNLSAAFAPVRTYDDRPSGNAILSTQPLEDTRAITLPRARQQRGAVAARVTLAGEPLFVVSTHFENRVGLLRGLLFADGARERQAESLLAALPVEGSGVAGGDLNTLLGRGEPALRALAARFIDTPKDPSPPTFRGKLVLDHLFFDLPPGWEAERIVSRDRYGSDHHPVIGLVRRVSEDEGSREAWAAPLAPAQAAAPPAPN